MDFVLKKTITYGKEKMKSKKRKRERKRKSTFHYDRFEEKISFPNNRIVGFHIYFQS